MTHLRDLSLIWLGSLRKKSAKSGIRKSFIAAGIPTAGNAPGVHGKQGAVPVPGAGPNQVKQGPQTYAWDNNLPCLNTLCKSHGRPHPNCRCYDHMADGGEVKPFCSSSRAHKPGCEYFADGGDVGMSWEDMPDQTFEGTPESSAPQNAPSGSHEMSFDDMPDQTFGAEPEAPASKYESIPQQALTAGEGFAQGMAGPLATLGELGLSKLGVPGLTAEDIQGRQQTNPWIHGGAETAGIITGAATGSGIGGGALSIAEHLAPDAWGHLASRAVQNGIQSALITGSDEASKAILGHSDINDAVAPALGNMAISGLFGSVLGSAFGGAEDLLSAGAKKIMSWKKIDPEAAVAFGSWLQKYKNGFGFANAKDIEQTSGTKIGSEAYAKAMDVIDKGGSEAEYEKYLNQWRKDVAKPEGLNDPAGKQGMTDYWKWLPAYKAIAPLSLASYNAMQGYHENGVIGAAKGGFQGLAFGLAANLGLEALPIGYRNIMVPGFLKIISNSEGKISPTVVNSLNYFKSIADGGQKISNSINNLFVSGQTEATEKSDTNEKYRKIVDDYFRNGGLNQNIIQQQNQIQQDVPQFAEGGYVEAQPQTPLQKGQVTPLLSGDNSIATHFPDHNIALQSARARVSNYLTSLKPNDNPQKFSFDRKPDQGTQEKHFGKAIDMAINPLSVLDKIKNGRLTKDDMVHFTSLYPEVYQHLQKKLTERIIHAQLKDEKPSAKVRQSMSLFMGAPMDSTFTQPYIAAAQSVFASKQQQQQGQQSKPKKSQSSLTKSSQQYQTATEASAERTQVRG